jgi:FkbM family methyltransferase
VGSNIGLYSLYAGIISPQSTVYGFEPAASNYLRLCNNIVLNGVTIVIPCNFPLSDLEAFDLFYVSNMEPGSALHSAGHVSEFRPDANTASLIQGTISVTLDALIGKYGVPKPARLKIDVDGIEERILNGAGRVLKSEKLRTILVELSFKKGSAGTDVERRLAHFGYKLSRKSEWVFELNNFISQNYIFER